MNSFIDFIEMQDPMKIDDIDDGVIDVDDSKACNSMSVHRINSCPTKFVEIDHRFHRIENMSIDFIDSTSHHELDLRKFDEFDEIVDDSGNSSTIPSNSLNMSIDYDEIDGHVQRIPSAEFRRRRLCRASTSGGFHRNRYSDLGRYS